MSEDLKKQIIFEIQRIAKEQNLNMLSKEIFKRYSNISQHHIYKIFGSWNKAVVASGLNPDNSAKKKTDEKLFSNLLTACEKFKKIPRSFNYCRKTCRKKFGSWDNTLIEFKKWLLKNHPSSEYIDLIEEKVTVNKTQIKNGAPTRTTNEVVWQRKKGVVYGSPMDYKGLRHERGHKVRGQRTRSTGRRGLSVGVKRKSR